VNVWDYWFSKFSKQQVLVQQWIRVLCPTSLPLPLICGCDAALCLFCAGDVNVWDYWFSKFSKQYEGLPGLGSMEKIYNQADVSGKGCRLCDGTKEMLQQQPAKLSSRSNGLLESVGNCLNNK
jgi:hypothetical protein